MRYVNYMFDTSPTGICCLQGRARLLDDLRRLPYDRKHLRGCCSPPCWFTVAAEPKNLGPFWGKGVFDVGNPRGSRGTWPVGLVTMMAGADGQGVASPVPPSDDEEPEELAVRGGGLEDVKDRSYQRPWISGKPGVSTLLAGKLPYVRCENTMRSYLRPTWAFC